MASSPRAAWVLVSVFAACSLSACGDDEPNAAPPKFTAIYDDILFANCTTAGCHGNVGGGGSAGNLDLSTRDKAYAALVDQAAAGPECKDSGLQRVVPAEPEHSLLYSKLAGAPPCGDPMPLGSMLSSAELAAIKGWIAAGALDE